MASALWKFFLYCSLEIQCRSGQLNFPMLERRLLKIMWRLLKKTPSYRRKKKVSLTMRFVLFILCICFGWEARYTGIWKAKWEQRGEMLWAFWCTTFLKTSQPLLVKLAPLVWVRRGNDERDNQQPRQRRRTDWVTLLIPASAEIWIFIRTT